MISIAAQTKRRSVNMVSNSNAGRRFIQPGNSIFPLLCMPTHPVCHSFQEVISWFKTATSRYNCASRRKLRLATNHCLITQAYALSLHPKMFVVHNPVSPPCCSKIFLHSDLFHYHEATAPRANFRQREATPNRLNTLRTGFRMYWTYWIHWHQWTCGKMAYSRALSDEDKWALK